MHTPISVNSFQGIFDSDEAENVPQDYLIDALNVDWDGSVLRTRDGSTLKFSKNDILRWYEYRRIGEASRYLILTTGGTLFDSTNLSTPIATVSGMVDFSAITMFNRCYISPHNRIEGLPAEKVYVYDGTTWRAAAGIAPTGTLVAVTSATPGNVDDGFRLFAVSFETASGFITRPGPTVYAQYTGPGSFKVDLSGIPTGPAGTTKRHLLATRVIVGFTGDQDGYSYYFVPGGLIPDNTATTKTVNFYEEELFVSADYLFQELETIPASLGLTTYAGKLVTWGADGEESIVRVSKKGEPESMNSANGFLTVDPAESTGVKNCIEFRDSLYMFKSARGYQTTDNNAEPATWTWLPIDKGFGTEIFGIGTILDSKAANIEGFLVADVSGLYFFNGAFQEPSLDSVMQKRWDRINPNYFNQVQVAVNPKTKRIFVSVPLDAATVPSHIFVGNYEYGLGKIRWTTYTFPVPQTSIGITIDSVTGKYVLMFSRTHNIYILDSAVLNDAGTAIPTPFVQTALWKLSDGAEIHHFGMIHLRVKGSGVLNTVPYGIDMVAGTTLKATTMSANPQGEIPIPNAFVNERMSLRFSTTNINDWFRLIKVKVDAKVLYKSGPA